MTTISVTEDRCGLGESWRGPVHCGNVPVGAAAVSGHHCGVIADGNQARARPLARLAALVSRPVRQRC
jgi:UDP-N-acetylenolpyruvoylglucosamine reductase